MIFTVDLFQDWKFIWETLKRPKYSAFSFFRRSRHRQIRPSRVTSSSAKSARKFTDIDKHFLISNLTKEYTKKSSLSSKDSTASTSGIQRDLEQVSLPGISQAYSTVSAPVRLMRSRTSDSLGTSSDITLDEMCDSVSIYSEIFLPEHWLFENEEFYDKCWRTGSRFQMAKVKNKVKAWLANDANAFPLK